MDFRETSHYTTDEVECELPTSFVSEIQPRKESRPRHDFGVPTSTATPRALNHFLDHLPTEGLRLLTPRIKPVLLKHEQFLYQEGEHLEYIYFPDSAVISEFKMLEDGRMVEVAVTGKEGALGLSSILSGSTVVQNFSQISQAGTARRLDARTFAEFIRSNETIRRELTQYVAAYIKQISQKAICNMFHSVKERLCTWLLMLQDRCGESVLRLTHEQIARTLGVYRPSVTCITQELREMKLINYSRGGITMGDRRPIELAACSCYAEMGSSVFAN